MAYMLEWDIFNFYICNWFCRYGLSAKRVTTSKYLFEIYFCIFVFFENFFRYRLRRGWEDRVLRIRSTSRLRDLYVECLRRAIVWISGDIDNCFFYHFFRGLENLDTFRVIIPYNERPELLRIIWFSRECRDRRIDDCADREWFLGSYWFS